MCTGVHLRVTPSLLLLPFFLNVKYFELVSFLGCFFFGREDVLTNYYRGVTFFHFSETLRFAFPETLLVRFPFLPLYAFLKKMQTQQTLASTAHRICHF